jgi:hypothetical protein
MEQGASFGPARWLTNRPGIALVSGIGWGGYCPVVEASPQTACRRRVASHGGCCAGSPSRGPIRRSISGGGGTPPPRAHRWLPSVRRSGDASKPWVGERNTQREGQAVLVFSPPG